MPIKSPKNSTYQKIMLASLLAFSSTGQASTAAGSPKATPGASPAPNAASPFEKKKVQLDFDSMRKQNPDFEKSNSESKSDSISPSSASGGRNNGNASTVVLPKGTRLATLIKNSCLRDASRNVGANSVGANSGGSPGASSGANSGANSLGTMSQQVSKSNAPVEGLDVQAYSSVTNRDMTVEELSAQADNDPCVVGVADDAKVTLDPFEKKQQEEEAKKQEAPSTNGRDDTAGTMAASNDPRVGEQTFLKAIHADTTMDKFFDARTGIRTPVVIAIVDTGVKYDHPDLADNMWTNGSGYHGYDFVNRDNYPMDDGGHGTHCAGLAAAVRNNGVGGSGVMGTDAKIMAVKSLSSAGSGYVSDIVNGINYAAKNGANVISMSFGGPGKNAAYQAAVMNAVKGGATMFASAGNSNLKLTDGAWSSPGSYARDIDGFVSVGSFDSKSLDKSWFSNYSSAGYVEIGSPGNVGLLSTLNNGGYGEKSGTSMAAPVTAGAAGLTIGLLKSRGYPTNPALVEKILRESANTRSNLNAFFANGKILDLERLLQLIDSRYPPK